MHQITVLGVLDAGFGFHPIGLAVLVAAGIAGCTNCDLLGILDTGLLLGRFGHEACEHARFDHEERNEADESGSGCPAEHFG